MHDFLRKFLEDKGHEKIEVKAVVPDVEDCFMGLMQVPGSDLTPLPPLQFGEGEKGVGGLKRVR